MLLQTVCMFFLLGLPYEIERNTFIYCPGYTDTLALQR